MGDDPWRKKAQARPPGRGVDDDDDGAAFDCGDPEAFRPGQVKVAFEGFFATPQFVRAPCQCSEDGPVAGQDGADRLPWTGAFGTRHRTFRSNGNCTQARWKHHPSQRHRTDIRTQP